MCDQTVRNHILVVEDEAKTAATLQRGLSEQGFTVDVQHRGDLAVRAARERHYDLIILDVMLPGRDGWSILTELRQGGRTTPVLFLTARDAVHDRVKGLELGADDYLVKPFAFVELLARVRSVLRRIQAPNEDILQIADLVIDLILLKVERGGRPVNLSPKEFQLLSLLARRQGEILPRKLVTEQVWGLAFDPGTNVVDVAIRRLRQRIDEGQAIKLIHTVRGMGYVLEQRD